MFPVSSAFATANAALAKEPVYVLKIRGYHYAFSTSALPSFVDNFLGVGGLCGAFTDSSGNFIQGWQIGKTRTVLIVPPGATQLQLGINDDAASDNTSTGFDVLVNGVLVHVPPTAMPWLWVSGGLNTAYQYGNQSGTGPVIAATGLTAGQAVIVAYQGGTVFPGGAWIGNPPVDADGYQFAITGPVTTNPTGYMQNLVTVQPWITALGDLKETVSDLDGGSNLSDCVVNVLDAGQLITADLGSPFIFEGNLMSLLHGFQGMTLANYATLFTGVVNTVESDNGNNEYKFTCSPKNLTKLSAKIYTTGNNAALPVDSNNPLTLSGHPLDMFVSALQQAGVALSDIDTNKIYFYRDNLFSGLLFEFTLTSAPTAKDFIENELMKPLAMYFRENNLGMITVNSFYPALSGAGAYTPPSLPVKTLTIDESTDVPLPGEADLVNQVITKFDDDGTGNQKFNAENIANYDASITKYGLVGGRTIESQGLKSSLQGYLISDLVSFLIFLRYGLKNLLIDSLPCTWDNVTLEPGDVIALTEPYVPDRKAGVLGITAQTFEILDRNWKLMDGIAEFKLLAIDLTKFKQYLITPNAEPDYASDTALNQAKYMYLCDAAGKYSTGANANTLG